MLLPPIYLLVKRDVAFLLSKITLTSAAVVAVLTVPWYAATYQMATETWAYTWGWSHTHLAIPFYTEALFLGVGIPLALLYLAGAAWAFYAGAHTETESVQPDIAAFAATSVSMLTFTLLAPADLMPPYLIPALPSIAIVSMWAATRLTTKIPLPRLSSTVLLALAAVFSIATAFELPRTVSLRSSALVRTVLLSRLPNPLVLVAGGVDAEGAVVASFAERDLEKTYYLVRAQKVLAIANWMTTQYELKFNSPQEMPAGLKAIKLVRSLWIQARVN